MDSLSCSKRVKTHKKRNYYGQIMKNMSICSIDEINLQENSCISDVKKQRVL